MQICVCWQRGERDPLNHKAHDFPPCFEHRNSERSPKFKVRVAARLAGGIDTLANTAAGSNTQRSDRANSAEFSAQANGLWNEVRSDSVDSISQLFWWRKDEHDERIIKSKEPFSPDERARVVRTNHCEQQIIEHQGQIRDADQLVHLVDPHGVHWATRFLAGI